MAPTAALLRHIEVDRAPPVPDLVESRCLGPPARSCAAPPRRRRSHRRHPRRPRHRPCQGEKGGEHTGPSPVDRGRIQGAKPGAPHRLRLRLHGKRAAVLLQGKIHGCGTGVVASCDTCRPDSRHLPRRRERPDEGTQKRAKRGNRLPGPSPIRLRAAWPDARSSAPQARSSRASALLHHCSTRSGDQPRSEVRTS